MQGAAHIMDEFGYPHKLLVDRLLSQGYEVKRLRNSFKKFYGRYPDLIGKYQRSVKDMVAVIRSLTSLMQWYNWF